MTRPYTPHSRYRRDVPSHSHSSSAARTTIVAGALLTCPHSIHKATEPPNTDLPEQLPPLSTRRQVHRALNRSSMYRGKALCCQSRKQGRCWICGRCFMVHPMWAGTSGKAVQRAQGESFRPAIGFGEGTKGTRLKVSTTARPRRGGGRGGRKAIRARPPHARCARGMGYLHAASS